MQNITQPIETVNLAAAPLIPGFSMRGDRRPQAYNELKQVMPQPMAHAPEVDEIPEFIATGALVDFGLSFLEAFSSKPAAPKMAAPRRPGFGAPQRQWAGMMGPSFA